MTDHVGCPRELYPLAEPFVTGYLDVGGPHCLYYEQSGNSSGVPVVCLHGGPGSGCAPRQRRFFDPERFHIVLYDQRGAGKSRPQACLEANTTPLLLADLEALRHRLGLGRWMLFGGSWGAALALLYAQAHPERVTSLVLRGVFLARPRDQAWFFGCEGVARLFPEAYAAFLEGGQAEADGDPVNAYHRRLSGSDRDVRYAAALAWHTWEHTVVSQSLDTEAEPPAPDVLLTRAAIACHYARHGFFLADNGALADVARLEGIPGVIVHGRRDLVCPLESAVTVQRAWPESMLVVLENCGHTAAEPAMQDALMRAAESLAEQSAAG